MTFKRTKEDFVCEHCGASVEGDGYTNHCPKCLWSKHVDVDPGDRKASCGGMMEPVDVENHHGVFRVLHTCLVCGFKRPSPITPKDDFDVALLVAKEAAKRKEKSLR